nr:MAG TPA: hypothetical protein [Caudoviricetes sp.]
MPNGFLDVTVKTSPNFSAFKIGVQSGMRPLVVGCAPSLFRCVSYLSRFLRRAFTGGSDPAFTAAGIEPAPCQMAALFRCCAAYKSPAVAHCQ